MCYFSIDKLLMKKKKDLKKKNKTPKAQRTQNKNPDNHCIWAQV